MPLRCWEARRDVSGYLDGELADERRRLVERHLATVQSARPSTRALVGMKAELGGLRDRECVVNPALAQRIVEALRLMRGVST